MLKIKKTKQNGDRFWLKSIVETTNRPTNQWSWTFEHFFNYSTFCKIDVSGTILGAILRLEIHHEPFNALFCRSDEINSFHSRQGLSSLLHSFHDWNAKLNLVKIESLMLLTSRMSSLLVIPSADNSCIFVQADTIRMDWLSTTRTRHSMRPGCLLCSLTVARTTSFMISEKIRKAHQFIQSQVWYIWRPI